MLGFIWFCLDGTRALVESTTRARYLRLSAGLERPGELGLQRGDPPSQRLAFDLRVGDLRVAGEAAEQMAVAAVEISSGLMAAIERREATRAASLCT